MKTTSNGQATAARHPERVTLAKARTANNQENTLMWMYEDFDLVLTEQDILSCSHAGMCDADCQRTARKPYVADQLKDVPSAAIIDALLNMGITINDESDRQELSELIVWDAACNLREDLRGSLSA